MIRLIETSIDTMTGANPLSAKDATGKSKWRKKIGFWKGEKLHVSETDRPTHSSVVEVPSGIDSTAARTKNARQFRDESSQREEANNPEGIFRFPVSARSVSACPLSVSSLVLPLGSYDAEGATNASTTSVLPVQEERAAMRQLQLNAHLESFIKEAKSLKPLKVSYRLDDNAIMQSPSLSLKSKEKALASMYDNAVEHEGVAAAFAAATQAIERSAKGVPTSVTRDVLSANGKLELDMEKEWEVLYKPLPLRLTGGCLSVKSCHSAETFETNYSSGSEDQLETDKFKSRLNTTPSSVIFELEAFDADQEGGSNRLQQKEKSTYIKKELVDRRLHESHDQGLARTITGNEGDDQYNVAYRVMDKVALFFSCFPSMPLFSAPTSPDGDVYDDGTYLDDGTDASYTIGTFDDHTLSTYENSCDTYSMSNNSYNSLQHEGMTAFDKPDDSSYTGSFMDQSHIYLMMTNERQQRSADKKYIQTNRLNVSTGNDNSNRNYQLIMASVDHNHSDRFKEMPPPLLVKTKKTNSRPSFKLKDLADRDNCHAGNGLTDATNTAAGWDGHFQWQSYLSENRQDTRADVQKMWLQAVHEAIENHNDRSQSSLIMKQRRLAAHEALREMLDNAMETKRGFAL